MYWALAGLQKIIGTCQLLKNTKIILLIGIVY